MPAADGEPNGTQLPPELLDRIARKTRDDVTAGVTLFRSVCRAWRAAARDAPRLLLPAAAPATRSCSRWPAGGAAAEGTLILMYHPVHGQTGWCSAGRATPP